MSSLFEDIAIEKANKLLDMLNEGRKRKEQYSSQYFFEHNGYIVFMAANSKKDLLFNVLDSTGEIPEDFPVNWRTLPHIKKEIKL